MGGNDKMILYLLVRCKGNKSLICLNKKEIIVKITKLTLHHFEILVSKFLLPFFPIPPNSPIALPPKN